MFEQLNSIGPFIGEIISAIVLIIIGVAADKFRQWTGVQIDEKHLRALHLALTTGAETRLASDPAANVQSVANSAKHHAMQSVPDAMKKLAPSPDVFDRLASAAARRAISAVVNRF